MPPGLVDRALAFGQGEALVAGKIASHPALVRLGSRLSYEGGADVAGCAYVGARCHWETAANPPAEVAASALRTRQGRTPGRAPAPSTRSRVASLPGVNAHSTRERGSVVRGGRGKPQVDFDQEQTTWFSRPTTLPRQSSPRSRLTARVGQEAGGDPDQSPSDLRRRTPAALSRLCVYVVHGIMVSDTEERAPGT